VRDGVPPAKAESFLQITREFAPCPNQFCRCAAS
jgi:hypothetical protein